MSPRHSPVRGPSSRAANRESLPLRPAIDFSTSLPGSFFILVFSIFSDRDFPCGSRLRFLCQTVCQYQFSTWCHPPQQAKYIPRMTDANLPEIIRVDFSESVWRKRDAEFRILNIFDFMSTQPIVSPVSKFCYDSTRFVAQRRAGVDLFSASTAWADFSTHHNQ